MLRRVNKSHLNLKLKYQINKRNRMKLLNKIQIDKKELMLICQKDFRDSGIKKFHKIIRSPSKKNMNQLKKAKMKKNLRHFHKVFLDFLAKRKMTMITSQNNLTNSRQPNRRKSNKKSQIGGLLELQSNLMTVN